MFVVMVCPHMLSVLLCEQDMSTWADVSSAVYHAIICLPVDTSAREDHYRYSGGISPAMILMALLLLQNLP